MLKTRKKLIATVTKIFEINIMSKNIIVVIFFLIGIHQIKSQDVDQIVIGTKHILHSNILNEDREYWVTLPESYNNEGSSYKSYPVLIVLDGKFAF